MTNTSLKERLFLHCESLMAEKVQSLKVALSQITESANNETKSSAGDKHETARAMMQLEQEKLSRQINEALQVQAELLALSRNTSTSIAKGSLIS
ncbi:MAG TPA: 3-oxoacyl-ACP synthase, partial [Bacteroidia bacterium]|nr:3-oxoacyl-ACP synthase [Bacteroidia bacterium]